MLGIELCESLTGTLRFAADPSREHALALTYLVRIGPGLARGGALPIEGAIEAEHLAAYRLVHGTIALDPKAPRALRYALAFTADDGRALRFTGRRALDLHHPVDAFSLLPGVFLDDRGEAIARALLRLDLRTDLGRWLRSLRLVRS